MRGFNMAVISYVQSANRWTGLITDSHPIFLTLLLELEFTTPSHFFLSRPAMCKVKPHVLAKLKRSRASRQNGGASSWLSSLPAFFSATAAFDQSQTSLLFVVLSRPPVTDPRSSS